MEKTIINENQVKEVIEKLINEEVSKVSRQEFSRVQFKIEELQNSLNETIKEMRKLEDSIPSGLKTMTNGRLTSISSYLYNSQKLLSQLKDKVKQYKKSTFNQQMDERKKK
jgi:chorismate synthase